ncbi:hypothetical protein TSAR_005683 [Trichomalopsis sarcophagae]|uniref:Uncharacterized protein n=1 Tax=Trichomalopsis sarcophagae TaxID=543379 RepID=A0A232FIU8_9HYME|nr:hypothetical protein TSAR_005683 [Trichomalopsis sarcophagae]
MLSKRSKYYNYVAHLACPKPVLYLAEHRCREGGEHTDAELTLHRVDDQPFFKVRFVSTFRDAEPGAERGSFPALVLRGYIASSITHWQHPRFHAYFPAGNSFPSILGDMLSDAIGCIGFSWLLTLVLKCSEKVVFCVQQTEGGINGYIHVYSETCFPYEL